MGGAEAVAGGEGRRRGAGGRRAGGLRRRRDVLRRARVAERTVLVIDDDEEILLVVKALLEGAGYAVLSATSGNEGLKLATGRHPSLILLDVMMPQLSGWEVCSTLKNLPETSAIPVVMLTVKSEIKDLITGMQAGADDFVTKPFTRANLLATVGRLVEGPPPPRGALFPESASEVRSRNVLFDAVTELPTLPLVVDALRDRLLVDQQVGVLYVDVEKYSHVEDTYGWEVFDEVLHESARALKRMLGTLLSTEDLLAIGR
ncbi:response regulator, partial [Acidobacteria bacterium ACD]|nr:response regulator [Acidobacteria bacterium ACD]